jgi:uncharacterized protein YjbI with pentapeptide repeats
MNNIYQLAVDDLSTYNKNDLNLLKKYYNLNSNCSIKKLAKVILTGEKSKMPTTYRHDLSNLLPQDILNRLNLTTFDNADLSNVNLSNNDFSDITLNNTDFSNSKLHKVIFTRVKLLNCKFNKCNLSNLRFNNVILENCIFDDANLNDIIYDSTDIEYKFFNCNLIRANISKCKYFQMENCDLSNCILENTVIITCDKVNFTNANLKYDELSYCIYKNCNFTNTNFSDSIIIETFFDNCNFTNTNLTNSIMKGSILNNCDFTNANLTNVDLKDATLTNANLKDAIFRGACLNQTKIENSNFIEANSAGVIFTNCGDDPEDFIEDSESENEDDDNEVEDDDNEVEDDDNEVEELEIDERLVQLNTSRRRPLIRLNTNIPTRTLDESYINSCDNPIDTISQESWSNIINEDPSTDIIKIDTGKNSAGKNVIYCTVRENFINEINNQPLLTQWVIDESNSNVIRRRAEGLDPVDSRGTGTSPLENGPKFVKINYYYILVDSELNNTLSSGTNYKLEEYISEPVYIGNIDGEFGVSNAHGQFKSKIHKLKLIE